MNDVTALTQDAIFSRGPKGVKRTGIFIGGRDLEPALDMFDAAKKAMVPPFEVSVFADPSGAFTTAAAAVACVERHLRKAFGSGLARQARAGARRHRPGRRCGRHPGRTGRARRCSSPATARCERAQQVERDDSRRATSSSSSRCWPDADALESAASAGAEVVIAAAKAGVEVVPARCAGEGRELLVAADVNAVPPHGIAGIGVMDDGEPLAAAASVRPAASARWPSATSNTRWSAACSRPCSARRSRCIWIFVSAFANAREVIQAEWQIAVRLAACCRGSPSRNRAIAISGRALAQSAAKSGFTRARARRVRRSRHARSGRAPTASLRMARSRWTPSACSRRWAPLGPERVIVVGSGFERSPQLLDRLAAYGLLCANDADVGRGAERTLSSRPSCCRRSASTVPRDAAYATARCPRLAAERHRRRRRSARAPAQTRVASRAAATISARYPDVRCRSRSWPTANEPGLLGFNEQFMRAVGDAPFCYAGAATCTVASRASQQRMQAGLDRLVRVTELRGLNGVDFLLDGAAVYVLEVNPRPTATFELYDEDFARGLVHWHVRSFLAPLPSFAEHLRQRRPSKRAPIAIAVCGAADPGSRRGATSGLVPGSADARHCDSGRRPGAVGICDARSRRRCAGAAT